MSNSLDYTCCVRCYCKTNTRLTIQAKSSGPGSRSLPGAFIVLSQSYVNYVASSLTRPEPRQVQINVKVIEWHYKGIQILYKCLYPQRSIDIFAAKTDQGARRQHASSMFNAVTAMARDTNAHGLGEQTPLLCLTVLPLLHCPHPGKETQEYTIEVFWTFSVRREPTFLSLI